MPLVGRKQAIRRTEEANDVNANVVKTAVNSRPLMSPSFIAICDNKSSTELLTFIVLRNGSITWLWWSVVVSLLTVFKF